jgi:hypothetical protein
MSPLRLGSGRKRAAWSTAVVLAAGAAFYGGLQFGPAAWRPLAGVIGTSSPSQSSPPGSPAGTSPSGSGHSSSRPSKSPHASPSASRSHSRHHKPPAHETAAQRLIPAKGAYLGAFVQPSSYTASGLIAAVNSFERTVHRQIDLVHVYHPWNEPFPDAADRHWVESGKVLLLTWSGTPDTRKIIAGSYDALIRIRAEAVKRLGKPILMEFRHEMDRPNLQWAVHGPTDFIKAWDRIRAIFNQVGAKNVAWVWCPTGYGFARNRAQPFYPGNSQVDFVCADVYSGSASESLAKTAAPFLHWAAHTGKPVIIGEFAVNSSPTAWAKWLLAAGRLAENDRQIKAMAYFDANGTDSNGHPFHYWLGESQTATATFARLLTWQFYRPAMPAGV